MADTRLYYVLQQKHIDKWNPTLQTVQSGVEFTVQWASTGVVFPVFVPNDALTPDNVNTLIVQRGQQSEQFAQLGTTGSGTASG